MFTYQEKKVAALTFLTFFWLVVLMLKIDVDKEEVPGEHPKVVSLESVKEPMFLVSAKKEEDVIKEMFQEYPPFSYPRDWDVEESYLLAKIAMAEAEGENLRGKTFVIMTVLNRVHSDGFPNTIKEVILQERGGVYQFSPVMPGGRWWTTEPNEECWEAVKIVQESMYDYSGGALYFESSNDVNSWHSRNLDFLYETGGHKFYK